METPVKIIPEETVNILMVEDDPHLGYLLKENFEGKGFLIHLCKDGMEGYDAFRSYQFGLCILDVMLPKKDGFALAREIRHTNQSMPIIFLTARSMQEDKLHGFELGCDDYITKPFSAQELLMRIKAILKRTTPPLQNQKKPVYQLGDYTFDYNNRLLIFSGEARKLSTKESELLKLFCSNMNSLLLRNLILTKVWGSDNYFASKSMDVYLSKLRKLLREDPRVEIQNLHGTGFKLMLHMEHE
jgi:DNA-binding response OmpR family regulator